LAAAASVGALSRSSASASPPPGEWVALHESNQPQTAHFWNYCARFLHCYDVDYRDLDVTTTTVSSRLTYAQLWDRFWQRYHQPEQLLLLFALLPSELQPISRMQQVSSTMQDRTLESTTNSMLLSPTVYQAILCPDGCFTVQPPVPDAYFTSTTIMTRTRPLTPRLVALLGWAGASGCTLTHTAVVPLDVVKTRAQKRSDRAATNLVQQASQMVATEGVSSLWQGWDATIVGYFWYGLSVYPIYALGKQAWGMSMGASLAAGAMAAIVASLGLTPLEAARIRAVNGDSTGLWRTLQELKEEQALYSGLSSLLIRQVVFGSIKFLAFEQFYQGLQAYFPNETSSLVLSLLAGAGAGAISCVVSQPADAVLTYVATRPMPLSDAAATLVSEQGPTALFRGVTSRCLWAACIIGGQFVLYDVFRQALGVSVDDLTQVYRVMVE